MTLQQEIIQALGAKPQIDVAGGSAAASIS